MASLVPRSAFAADARGFSKICCRTQDVGPCAVYPDGVYEYGQIGIGSCLAGPVDNPADHLPGQFAVDDFQLIGGVVIDTQRSGQRCHNLGEATRNQRNLVVHRLQHPAQGAGARGQPQRLVDLVEHINR